MQLFRLILLVSVLWSCQPKTTKIEISTSPASTNSSLPYLVRGDNGHVFLSWVELSESRSASLFYSKQEGGQWSQPEVIRSGNDWFVNWADYPMIAIDKGGNMIAHYLSKNDSGTYSYNVNLVLKASDSNRWSNPIIPHSDSTSTEHGFVTMLPHKNNDFIVTWLDGRNTAGHDHGGTQNGAMTIRSAVIDLNGKISDEIELDNRVCDCCQTTGINTSSGPIFAYRDRSALEIRDIYFVKNTNGNWSSPKAVFNDEWNISGCPVNGPRMDSNDGTTALAWFTSAGGQSKVKVSFLNESQEFNSPILVTTGTPIGRVDVSVIDRNTAYVSWLENVNETSRIMIRRVNFDGTYDKPIRIAETLPSRSSGFPQMVYTGDDLLMAWTHIERDQSSIKMARITIPSN